MLTLPLPFDAAALIMGDHLPEAHDPATPYVEPAMYGHQRAQLMQVMSAAHDDTHPQHTAAQMALHDITTTLSVRGAPPLVLLVHRLLAHDSVAEQLARTYPRGTPWWNHVR